MIKLIHVGTQEASARRYLSKEDVPEGWGRGEPGGEFGFRRWADDQAMVTLTVRMLGDQHGVRVTIAALYEFVDGDTIPDDEAAVSGFYRAHMAELLPFLRQAVHTASSQVWPVAPILLDTLAWTAAEAASLSRLP